MMCTSLISSLIKLKECENEPKDISALHDPHTIKVLKNCESLKFFKT